MKGRILLLDNWLYFDRVDALVGDQIQRQRPVLVDVDDLMFPLDVLVVELLEADGQRLVRREDNLDRKAERVEDLNAGAQVNASLVELRDGLANDGDFVFGGLRVDLVDRVAVQVGVHVHWLPFLVGHLLVWSNE